MCKKHWKRDRRKETREFDSFTIILLGTIENIGNFRLTHKRHERIFNPICIKKLSLDPSSVDMSHYGT